MMPRQVQKDVEGNKKLRAIVTESFMRGTKLNISRAFIT